MRKAQSISINTIIIAAIALAVLVVLFAIFTGRLGSFSTGVSKTASCENSCKALGMTNENYNENDCKDRKWTVVSGIYSDASNGCCCRPS